MATLIMPSGQERNSILIRKGNRWERLNDVCLSEKRFYGHIIHHIKSISMTYINILILKKGLRGQFFGKYY
jgi:hypothetical protein